VTDSLVDGDVMAKHSLTTARPVSKLVLDHNPARQEIRKFKRNRDNVLSSVPVLQLAKKVTPKPLLQATL
jgi:hypothetical protein